MEGGPSAAFKSCRYHYWYRHSTPVPPVRIHNHNPLGYGATVLFPMKLYFDVIFQDKSVPIGDVAETIEAVAKELTTEYKWLVETVQDAGIIDTSDLAPHQMIHIIPNMKSLRSEDKE